ncbi:GNAT family N-acetyltransferase [Bdellovibrio sp. HCB290]|uniref:GNAT family N-acetyltransferase n=1 Tax=Bdellovibrio sp. HCB290 TaxID=3394356 RepID=UPI0039B39CB7
MNRFIETERISLREFIATDESELLDLDGDPEVMKYLTNGVASSKEDIQRFMNRVSRQLKDSNGKYGVWAAIEKESNQFTGWFHLFPSREEPNNFQKLFLGYRLKRKFWGKGYATEVSKALVQKAFEQYETKEVCAQAMKANLRSQQVMINVGMTFKHEFLEESFPVGSQDAVLFSIVKPARSL